MYIQLSLWMVLLLLSGVCRAESYVGFEYGQAETNQSDYKDSEPARLSLGTQLSDHLALEGAYAIVGNFHHREGLGGQSLLVEVKGLELLAIASYPATERLSLYLFAGLFSWDTKTLLDKSYVLNSDSGTDPTYGLGVNYSLTGRWWLGLKAQRYIDVSDADIEMKVVTLQYQF